MIQPLGPYDGSCGYCTPSKKEKKKAKLRGSRRYGASAETLTCADYQGVLPFVVTDTCTLRNAHVLHNANDALRWEHLAALLDRGWRRSGTYMYNVYNDASCCPNYTIRLDATRFEADKKQRKVLRKVRRLHEGARDEPASKRQRRAPSPSAGHAWLQSREISALRESLAPILLAAAEQLVERGSLPSDAVRGLSAASLPLTFHFQNFLSPQKDRTDVASAPISCALALRLAGKTKQPVGPLAAALQTQLEAQFDHHRDADSGPSWSVAVDDRGMLQLRPLRGEPKSLWTTLAETAERIRRDQRRGDASHSATCSGTGAATGTAPAAGDGSGAVTRGDREGRLRIEMIPAQFEEESFRLFCKYQERVHGDEPSSLSPESYSRFLVDTPLIPVPLDGPHHTKPVLDEPPASSSAEQRQLEELGFSRRVARAALRAGGGNLHAAVQSLLTLREGGIDADDEIVAALQSKVRKLLDRCHSRVQSAWEEGEGPGKGLPLATHGEGNTAGETVAHAGAGGDAAPTDRSGGGNDLSVPHAIAVDARTGKTDMSLGYGSFHQKYYWDGVLVAVAVIDILPQCLSSVYVFYDPDKPELELGKYSALREIQWVQQAHKVSPRLKWYYMGFYVHECHKMRYKADYRPSELLCPVTLGWVPVETVLPKLAEAKFCAFADESEVARVEEEEAKLKRVRQAMVDQLLLYLLRDKMLLTAGSLTEQSQDIVRPLLEEFVRLAGIPVASRVVIGLR